MTPTMKDTTFYNREILPISSTRFGIALTEDEAQKFRHSGFNVRVIPQIGEGKSQYYLQVWVGAYHSVESFNLPMLETTGRGDVTVHPCPWKIGKRSGIKAYVVSAKPTPPVSLKDAIARLKCVQAGWVFGVPEDGRDQWLDMVVAEIRKHLHLGD